MKYPINIRLKVFSGYADTIQSEFNAWMESENPHVTSIKVSDNRLYIFYRS